MTCVFLYFLSPESKQNHKRDGWFFLSRQLCLCLPSTPGTMCRRTKSRWSGKPPYTHKNAETPLFPRREGRVTAGNRDSSRPKGQNAQGAGSAQRKSKMRPFSTIFDDFGPSNFTEIPIWAFISTFDITLNKVPLAYWVSSKKSSTSTWYTPHPFQYTPRVSGRNCPPNDYEYWRPPDCAPRAATRAAVHQGSTQD